MRHLDVVRSDESTVRRKSPGAALLAVVLVLAVLMVLGVFFHEIVCLNFSAALLYRRAQEAKNAAALGLHQACAALQYDVWGVNERRAFVCAEPWGRLHDEFGGEFPPEADGLLPAPDGSVSFFTEERGGYRRITGQTARRRRPAVRVSVLKSGRRPDDPPIWPPPRPHPTDGNAEVEVVAGDCRWMVNWLPDYKRLGTPDNLGAVAPGSGLADADKISVASAAPFHDEFLPGPTDNSDLWELRVFLNAGARRNRSCDEPAGDPAAYAAAGVAAVGGNPPAEDWWRPGRDEDGYRNRRAARLRFDEYDYVDTRLSGDFFYRIFRFDLVAGPDASAEEAWRSFESGLDPRAFEDGGRASFPPESPRRYLCARRAAADVHPLNRQRLLRATHLGDASDGVYTDTRGGAVNLNQLNLNAAAEWFQAGPPAETTPSRVNESKWIYLYNAAASPADSLERPFARFALLIRPESGLPNVNAQGYPAAAESRFLRESWSTARYLRALDAGTDERGAPLPPPGRNLLAVRAADRTACDRGKGVPFFDDWAEDAATALAVHVRGGKDGSGALGQFTSRDELAMVLRKRIWTRRANSGVSPERLESAAAFVAEQFTVHAAEYLLGPHWENDRLVLDRGREPEDVSAVFYEPNPNRPESIAARRRWGEILNGLRFVWGPDEAREGTFTPWHEEPTAPPEERRVARRARARALARLLSGALDAPTVVEWPYPNARGVGRGPSWWGTGEREPEQPLTVRLLSRKPDHAVGVEGRTWEVRDRIAPDDLKEGDEWAVAYAWAPRLSEVGRLVPKKFADLPHRADGKELTNGPARPAPPLPHGRRGGHRWDFDGETEYRFVELRIAASDPRAPLRWRLMEEHGGKWWEHWQLFVMDPGDKPLSAMGRGCNDVLKLPSTRVLVVDRAADPWRDEVFGGDARTAESRADRAGLNRLKVFEPCRVFSGGTESDARGMTLPGPSSLNVFTFRMRRDTPRPLSLRSILKESAEKDSLRRGGWKESFGRFHPANYLLVLFDPRELPPDRKNKRRPPAGRLVRWCCLRQGSANRGRPMLLDAVDFPSGSRPFEEGWEAVGGGAARLGARAWRRARPFAAVGSPAVYRPRSPYPPHPPLNCMKDRTGRPTGPFSAFTGSPAFRFFTKGDGPFYNWCDGLNENDLAHNYPGGERNLASSPAAQSYTRRDAEDACGAKAWYAACSREASEAVVPTGAPGAAEATLNCGLPGELLKLPLGWFSETIAADKTGVKKLLDPDLRTWRDLMRYTPLEQWFTIGCLGGLVDNRPARPWMHYLYPHADGLDNDADGRADRLVPEGLFPGESAGRFQSDRKSISRMNLNEISSPLVLAYAGSRLGGGLGCVAILGRKPLKGYLTWADLFTRGGLDGTGAAPYDVLRRDDTPYADLAPEHADVGALAARLPLNRFDAARRLFVGHSSVYTIYCLAQVLDDGSTPLAEYTTRATVERTYDGKLNILSYRCRETR